MNKEVYGGTWYADTMVTAPDPVQLNRDDLPVDVCVVGGGFSGLTTAYELLREGRSVALLEAERIACKASGRNGGFAIPGFALNHRQLIDELGGVPAVLPLWQLAENGLNYVRATAQGMQGVHLTAGLLLVQRKGDVQAAIEEARIYTSLGTNAVFWDTPRVQAAMGTQEYHQGVFLKDAFQLHPLNYALGLAARIVAAGGRIFENSPAIAGRDGIHTDLVGTEKRVVTPHGSIKAQAVVLAQGAEGKPLAEQAQRVMALEGNIAVTENVAALLGANKPDYAAFDLRELPTYHRRLHDGRLLWGSRLISCTGFVTPGEIKEEICADYPALGTVAISHVWSGKMAYVSHRMPVIDQIMPGVWYLNGFGGHGINTTAMAGQLVANAILTNNSTWQLFQRFRRGSAFGQGVLGRAGVCFIYRLLRICDWGEHSGRATDRIVAHGAAWCVAMLFKVCDWWSG